MVQSENRKCIFCWKVRCTYSPFCSNFCTNCILGTIRTLFQSFFLIPCRSAYEYNWDAAPSQERALLNSLYLRKSFSLRFTSLLDGFEFPFLYCGFYLTCETNLKGYLLKLTQCLFTVDTVIAVFKLHFSKCSGSVSGESVLIGLLDPDP
jgi:hypothetical protein